jgi:hypothetical protein
MPRHDASRTVRELHAAPLRGGKRTQQQIANTVSHEFDIRVSRDQVKRVLAV